MQLTIKRIGLHFFLVSIETRTDDTDVAILQIMLHWSMHSKYN